MATDRQYDKGTEETPPLSGKAETERNPISRPPTDVLPAAKIVGTAPAAASISANPADRPALATHAQENEPEPTALPDSFLNEENDVHSTQHFAEDGVEPDEAENDMATLALNPGLMQEEQSNRQAGVMDARMAERLVEGGDADLMLRLKAGDLQCFDVLMNKYRRQIVHFMFRMVRNQAVAEEMSQEVFLRVYRARETYRAEAKFTTWLYRIATNLAVNHARDTKNERLAPKVLLDEPEYENGSMPDVADSTPSVEADMVRRERMNAIKQHVMALPERQRMAVLMHKYQEMDYKSIGAVLKLSESATKSLLFRAYQTLRDKLKDFV